MIGMYVPAHFALSDDQVRALLHRLSFGELVTQGDQGLEATPLPWLYDPGAGERGSLVAHVARTNTQWRHAGAGEALVLLRGPDHYVSPAWLPSATEHGRVVPTWDYLTVHAYGELVAHEDPAWLRDAVERLTRRHEGGQERPWTTDRAPQRWFDGQLRAIVGVEVRLTRWVAKAKLSQNKSPADVEAEIAALTALGRADSADLLRELSLPAATRRAQVLADLGRRHRDGD